MKNFYLVAIFIAFFTSLSVLQSQNLDWTTPLPTGTGNETRDFTYVLDLVQGLIKAAYYKDAIGQAFNLASGKETKIKDMIKMVNKATGNKTKITRFPARKWDTKKRLLASIDLAKNLKESATVVLLTVLYPRPFAISLFLLRYTTKNNFS